MQLDRSVDAKNNDQNDNYTFTMSIDDQRKFIALPKDMKYKDMVEILRKSKLSDRKKEQDFKNSIKEVPQDKNGDNEIPGTVVIGKEKSKQQKQLENSNGNIQISRFVLSFLDNAKMQSTIMAFPLGLKLFDRNCLVESLPTTGFSHLDDPNSIYDVRFVMLVIYHSVSPTLIVDCENFILRRALSLTLAGLASECYKMRQLCYKILERFYEHLKSSLNVNRKIYINFVDLLRNSLDQNNQQLKPVFTLFLVRIIDIVVHPEDPLYELIKEFLSRRSKWDINTIEIFDDLISFSDVDKYQYAMRWLLSIFRDGLRTPADLKLAKHVQLLPYLLSLYNSQLRFERANQIICSILMRICNIGFRGINLLVGGHAFLPWLDNVLRSHLNHSDQEQSENQEQPIKYAKKKRGSYNHQITNKTDSNKKTVESLKEITTSLASLCFNLLDNFDARLEKCGDFNEDSMYDTEYIELLNVYLTLYDLILKAEMSDILAHHVSYAGKIVKMLHKTKQLSQQTKIQLYNTLTSKLEYLDCSKTSLDA